ncbi:response regulator [Sphingomonas sp. MS122]|uniref:response regulator n=1 Tax=Sphingomonas sp. MS122 TaxID=3412683 RepID=UPI003C2D1FE7
MLFGKKKRRITRLLIVEDEPLLAFDTEHFLTEEGFAVVATTDSVREAIGHLDGPDAIDLVLADLGLRDGNGADVAQAARTRNVPVLLVTGRPLDEVEAIAMGCLSKPYPQRHLLAAIAAIEALLDGRPPRRLPASVKLFQTTA